MTETMLQTIAARFPLTEVDCGSFARQKISGMRFHIRAFQAEGLGSVSVMTAAGFFGLMKMDTLIITPTQRDLPLFSYDRVLAMGNDTLIFELYDTLLTPNALPLTAQVKADAAGLPDHDLGTHWYDSIKLPQSLSKKGKQKDSAAFEQTALRYLEAFLGETATACEAAPKLKKAAVYVDGLLTHGGPSTDVFKKAIGEEKTATLFRKYLFATQP